jgi:hypothetical protein
MSQYDSSPVLPTGGAIDSLKDLEATPSGKRQRWAQEIAHAEKELKDWHSQARSATRKYRDDRDAYSAGARYFNLFKTNTEILEANLYANIPSVDVSRRFSDPADDVARVASIILQRAVQQDIDEPYCDFDRVMRQVVQDRLTAGLGTAWVRLTTETAAQAAVGDGPPPTDPETQQPLMEITDQEVCIDWVYWDDFLWSPCRVWAERRWVGRRVPMTKDQLVKRFGQQLAGQIPLDYAPNRQEQEPSPGTQNEVMKRAAIYEIWDREKREVIWFSKGHGELLDVKPDPLKLHDGRFEPSPEPLFANLTNSNCVPKPDYHMLQDQYQELNEVNHRISLLISACKVVGVYDQGQDSIKRMLQEGTENTLIPVDNWAMFAEKGGLKGVVDWLPLDVVIQALERLQQHREAIKAQIYELSGISDIVRGFTAASETLGAQELKSKYASIRIQKLQDSVTRFAQELLQIKADILVTHFEPAILAKLANVEYLTDAQMGLPPPSQPAPVPQPQQGPMPGMAGPPSMGAPPGPPALPVAGAGMAGAGAPPPIPMGAPPGPPANGSLPVPSGMAGPSAPPPAMGPSPPTSLPGVVGGAGPTAGMAPPHLQGPALIMAALQLLKADYETMEWRVSIQADSMAMVDYNRQKQERTEFLTSVATFLQSASTVGQGAPQLIPLMLELLKFGVAGFRVSKEIEGVFDKYVKDFTDDLEAQKNQPPPPDPATIKAQTDMQAKQQDAQLKQQSQQSDLQLAQQKHQQEMAQAAQEHQLKMQQMVQEFNVRMAQLEQEFQLKSSQMQADIAIKAASGHQKMVQDAQTHEQTMAQQADIAAQEAKQAKQTPKPSGET